MAVKKIALNLDEELLKKVEAYANSIHVNRTAAISVILSMYLDALTATQNAATLTEEIRKLNSQK